ncbi:MAG: SDR family oxidoreductase, partial [Deltaproteobacteria bacterium]|nr:SDR family oxidoreductase [Deltaproteobacteria bacterium]
MEFSGRTLVTGAAGFMGSHLVEFLVHKGVRVRASARPRKDTSFFDRLGVEYVAADLTKPETLPRLFEGGVDRVFHLGAICNFSTPYESLSPTNVDGVKQIT